MRNETKLDTGQIVLYLHNSVVFVVEIVARTDHEQGSPYAFSLYRVKSQKGAEPRNATVHRMDLFTVEELPKLRENLKYTIGVAKRSLDYLYNAEQRTLEGHELGDIEEVFHDD